MLDFHSQWEDKDKTLIHINCIYMNYFKRRAAVLRENLKIVI